MADIQTINQVHNFVMRRMVETGQAPFYTEVAAELGCGVEQGRQALRAMMDKALAAWFFPDTDLIASFAPFNNLPTQYRISVDGQQKWFGQ